MDPATSPPPRPRTAAAGRMRRYRERKQAGQVQVAINLSRAFIGDLAALGWLDARERTSTPAIGAAFLAFVERAWDLSRERPGLLRAPTGQG